MSHDLSCPRCRWHARRHDETFTHLDGTPLCPLPDGTSPAWPVDAAALPAPARDQAVARAHGHRDGDGCRPSELLRSVGLSVPDGPGCWLNAAAAQRLIITIHRAGMPLPYGSVGLSGRGLDRREVRALADWLGAVTAPALRRREAVAVPVLRAWLLWACCLYDGVSIRRRATIGPWSTWDRITGAFHSAGVRAGRDHSDWWQQDTLGGRVSGSVEPLAEHILTGIDDGDPAVLDALPRCDLPDPDEAAADAVFEELLPPGAPCWRDLKDTLRREAADAYRDGFDTAVHDRVAGHCRTALSSTGDAGHPHPR